MGPTAAVQHLKAEGKAGCSPKHSWGCAFTPECHPATVGRCLHTQQAQGHTPALKSSAEVKEFVAEPLKRLTGVQFQQMQTTANPLVLHWRRVQTN